MSPTAEAIVRLALWLLAVVTEVAWSTPENAVTTAKLRELSESVRTTSPVVAESLSPSGSVKIRLVRFVFVS